MYIDLVTIMENEGSKIDFNGSVDISDYNVSVNSKVSGKVKNFSGSLEFYAHVASCVTAVCSRCLATITTDMNFNITEIVGEDEDALEGSVLDVGSIVRKNIFCNLPMKFLCSSDCKGLCSKCGVNLNNEDCNCSDDEIDERLSALKKLLD